MGSRFLELKLPSNLRKLAQSLELLIIHEVF